MGKSYKEYHYFVPEWLFLIMCLSKRLDSNLNSDMDNNDKIHLSEVS